MPKYTYPVFDIGMEIEFFLLREVGKIYHAQKIMQNLLGFSIDQNNPYSGLVKLTPWWTLRTDGTPIELQWFAPYNRGRLPPRGELQDVLRAIKLLQDYQKREIPIVEEGESVTNWVAETAPKYRFIDPGTVYSSGKPMYDCYTGLQLPETLVKDKECLDKVDGTGKVVTMRTTGLHLHFSSSQFLFDRDNRQAVDLLVKKADDIFKGIVYSNLGLRSRHRIERYTRWGHYRIRDRTQTESTFPTFEYRQFDSTIDWLLLQTFIDNFQYAAFEVLNSSDAKK